MIYADNAATTKISDFAFEKMLPYLQGKYGNASSRYSFGVEARRAIEQARHQVAEAIHAAPSEITFTSGGSEGNSWVLQGVSAHFRGESMHIITSNVEHASVLNACHGLEKLGVAVTYLPVDGKGHVSVAELVSAIRPDTKLVSIMLANNEIGTIQPISEISKLLRDRNVLFHTDAVQAAGHIPINVSDLQVDFLTASAHKFNGAKGTGFLYMRAGVELFPLVYGGEQEFGLRAGTENVAGIVSAGYAIQESVSEMAATSKRLKTMVEATVKGIKDEVASVEVNGDAEISLPGIINIRFDGVSGESVVCLLDLKGIYVSTSSACTSRNGNTSHVLLALGLSEQQAKSSIRISYGKYSSLSEVDSVVAAISDSYAKIIATQ